MHSYSSLASLPTSSLSTSFDKTAVTKRDTALIIIGCEHTRFNKREHKLYISTADAIVLGANKPIYNIEVIRAAKHLRKHQDNLHIVLNDSSPAAQVLYQHLYSLMH